MQTTKRIIFLVIITAVHKFKIERRYKMQKKEIEKCKFEACYKDGTSEIFETNIFFFTGKIFKSNGSGMIVLSLGSELYDFYKILKTMERKQTEICKAIFKAYPNYNEIFKMFDFVNENGLEELKKANIENFNVSEEEFNNIKNMFSKEE
jgi:hypothetical protein